MYDYLICGSGLFGSTFANIAHSKGKKCLVMEKRNHIAGNVYSEKREGIDVHVYGPHIFQTKHKYIWDYVLNFCEMLDYWHIVKANYKDKIYSLPFNMNTFQELWGCNTSEEAKILIEQKRIKIENPKNLEEQALSMVGQEIYEKLIRDYTKKQWMHDPKDLPASIIKRIPLRFEFNNNYHDALYSGIPKDGYTNLVENMLEGIEVRLNEDFFDTNWNLIAKKIIYTGPIDRFFNYRYGELEYRTLKFEHKTLNIPDFQGISQMNYTSEDIAYTRIVEHKHFNQKNTNNTIITYEYPEIWNKDSVPYYPVTTDENKEIYVKYKKEAAKLENVIFGGRLAQYVYIDMDQTISMAINATKKEFH